LVSLLRFKVRTTGILPLLLLLLLLLIIIIIIIIIIGATGIKQKFTKISGNNTRTTLNIFHTKKTAILGTSHVIRKVLQAET
jgi:sorbitol-specific phosphotransferase system component IIC